METKSAFKSKTMQGLVIVFISLLMQIFAVHPQDVQPTYDQIHEKEDQPIALVFTVLQLLGLGYAGYGRVVASQPLKKLKVNVSKGVK